MRRMLGVGINSFMDPSSDLNGCVTDTANVRQLCVEGPLGMQPENVRLLCDERATRVNIFERLAWCSKGWSNASEEVDRLVIQFSTHGTQMVCRYGDELDDNMDEMLCAHNYPELWDSPKNSPDLPDCMKYLDQQPGPQICDDDLAVFLRNIPRGVYITLIVDACHSGTIDRGLSRRIGRFVNAPLDIRSRSMDRELHTRIFGVRPGSDRNISSDNPNVHYRDQRHVLLTGCRDDQTSADAMINGTSQGAMTWSLLKALTELGYHSGKMPSWLETHARMLELLKRDGYAQVPQLHGPQAWLEGPVFGG